MFPLREKQALSIRRGEDVFRAGAMLSYSSAPLIRNFRLDTAMAIPAPFGHFTSRRGNPRP
jgi:hypothetical protein